MDGYETLVILWDFVKFYDTMKYDVLLEECDANRYGRRRTALALQVHAAPRRLKMGTAISKGIPSVGQSIVAGCKKSQSMARAYTNRAVETMRTNFTIKQPSKVRPEMTRREKAMTLAREQFKVGIRVYQHVDDLA